MPIAQQTFFPINFANFVYQPLLPTNVGPFKPPTVTFPLTFYVGNPNAVDAAIYSKQLMAPYTSENKQYSPITSSGSKPIFNQDLAKILTLSQKCPLLIVFFRRSSLTVA